MNGNIVLLICSAIFLCVTTLYLAWRWPDLDVIDLYIIFVIFHFGLYPFVRGLYFGADVIFDFRHANSLALILVFLQVLIILAIIRLFSFYFFEDWLRYLKLRDLLKQWSQVNVYLLFLLYIVLISFPLGSYYLYGVRTYITPEDFQKMGKTLPYWLTSMRTIYSVLAFCVFIGLFAKMINSANYQRYLLIFLIAAFIPIVTVFGRRYFLNMILVAAIFWFVFYQKYIFNLKYLGVAVVLLVVFVIFSNTFEAYRSILQRKEKVTIGSFDELFSNALNVNITIRNLKARPGTWEFDYLVFNHQLSEPGMTTHGKISWDGFKSSIPRIIWRNKHFGLIDETLGKLYNVHPHDIDIGKNLFGVCQVDFWYYSILIVPFAILFIAMVMAGLLKITPDFPTFSCFLSGNILFFLINIEENGNEIFFMLRNIGILVVILGCYVAGRKILAKFSAKPG
jgi:hypothetical protein